MRRKVWVLIATTLLGVVAVVYWLTTTFYFCPVTSEDIRELSGHMASLFDGKYSLAEVVWITAHRVKNPRLKFALFRIHKSFDDPKCKPFSELMSDYPDVFPTKFRLAFDYSARLGKADVLLNELAKSWPDNPEKVDAVVIPILKSLAIQAIKNGDWFHRMSAVYILAYLEGRKSIPIILPSLQDPDPRVQDAARKVLQKLGYK